MRELVSNLDGVVGFEVRLIEDIDIDIDHMLLIGTDVFDLCFDPTTTDVLKDLCIVLHLYLKRKAVQL